MFTFDPKTEFQQAQYTHICTPSYDEKLELPKGRRPHVARLSHRLPQTQIARLRLLCRASASALRVIRAFTDKLDKVSAVPDRMSRVLFTAQPDPPPE